MIVKIGCETDGALYTALLIINCLQQRRGVVCCVGVAVSSRMSWTLIFVVFCDHVTMLRNQ